VVVDVEQDHHAQVAQRQADGHGKRGLERAHGLADQPVPDPEPLDRVHQPLSRGRRVIEIERSVFVVPVVWYPTIAAGRRLVARAPPVLDPLADGLHIPVEVCAPRVQRVEQPHEVCLVHAHVQVLRVHEYKVHDRGHRSVVHKKPIQTERVDGYDEHHAHTQHDTGERCVADVRRIGGGGRSGGRCRVRVDQLDALAVRHHCTAVLAPHDGHRHQARDAHRPREDAGHHAYAFVAAVSVKLTLEVRRHHEVEHAQRGHHGLGCRSGQSAEPSTTHYALTAAYYWRLEAYQLSGRRGVNL